jgi:hypothetical protein
MEVWEGQNYHSIMSMPRSRRYRIVLKKSDLEKERRARMQQETANARRR